MSIAKRIEEAITKMDAGDFEGALIQVSIAVDATASQEYPNMNNNNAYKNFIHNNFDLISRVSSEGTVTIGHLFLKYNHPDIIPNKNGLCSIEQILYHVVRCGLLHKAALPSDLKFIDKGMISVKNNSLVLPVGFIYGLLATVVVSPSNKNQRTSSNSIFNIHGSKISLNELWGNKKKLLRLYAGRVDNKSKVQHHEINIDMSQKSKEDKCLEATKVAVQKIEQQLSVIDKLKEKKRCSPEFKEWYRNTEIAIQKIFGQDTRHLKDFKDIDFGDNVVPEFELIGVNIDDEYNKSFNDGLDHVRAILNSFIKEINEYSLDIIGNRNIKKQDIHTPKKEKWYQTNTFKGAVIALVVTLLGGGIPAWLSLCNKTNDKIVKKLEEQVQKVKAHLVHQLVVQPIIGSKDDLGYSLWSVTLFVTNTGPATAKLSRTSLQYPINREIKLHTPPKLISKPIIGQVEISGTLSRGWFDIALSNLSLNNGFAVQAHLMVHENIREKITKEWEKNMFDAKFVKQFIFLVSTSGENIESEYSGAYPIPTLPTP